MAYRRLYQRAINADVPARVQILESGSEENEGHVPKIQNYSDWSKSNEYTHGRTVYQLCEGCRKSLTSYESEAHSPANNPILAVEKNNNTHLLTFSCFRSTCDYQYENIEEEHTFTKKEEYYLQFLNDNRYHGVGYKCDKNNIGCSYKTDTISQEHSYWADYGEAIDVTGENGNLADAIYCENCFHYLNRNKLPEPEIIFTPYEGSKENQVYYSISINNFNEELISSISIEAIAAGTLSIGQGTITANNLTFFTESTYKDYAIEVQCVLKSNNLSEYCNTSMVKFYNQ